MGLRTGKRKAPDKASKIKGVSWDQSYGKWLVRITTDGKQKHIGRFMTEAEAIIACNRAMAVMTTDGVQVDRLPHYLCLLLWHTRVEHDKCTTVSKYCCAKGQDGERQGECDCQEISDQNASIRKGVKSDAQAAAAPAAACIGSCS